jgi:adenosylcobinamide-phosphate synthase
VTALAVAFAIDLLFGDPPNRWHPVAWLGSLIAFGKHRFGRGPVPWLLAAGAAWTIVVAGIAALGGALAARASHELGVGGMVLEGVVLSCCLSVRGLCTAAGEIAGALETGDLTKARQLLSFHLVSRPTGELTEGEVAAATVESVAENLTDSIVAPALMYLAFGLPGAALYRAVNTADAMIGYREGALEHFGKLAARVDDVLNLIPARVSALAIVLAAMLTGNSARGAAKILWRDHRRTSSPNAGWTMSAMAGALKVCLRKRGAYELGDGPLPNSTDIRTSVRLMLLAASMTIAVAMTILGSILNSVF